MIIPDFAMEELMGDKERIKEFARINELEFMFLFSLLEREIEVYSQEEYEEFLSEARNISPYSMIVHKDGPYFALALSHHTPIWSNKKAFKEQSRVKVFSTSDLISFLSQA